MTKLTAQEQVGLQRAAKAYAHAHRIPVPDKFDWADPKVTQVERLLYRNIQKQAGLEVTGLMDAATRKLVAPRIPFIVKPLPGSAQSAFKYADPEGAPDRDGRRYHAAVDWFVPNDSHQPVRSIQSGKVVEVRASRGNSGQVFGGVVKVEHESGRVWVYRHVDPAVRLEERVKAGEIIARVTSWTDGLDHLHLECWRTYRGGYYVPNMVDPMTLLARVV